MLADKSDAGGRHFFDMGMDRVFSPLLIGMFTKPGGAPE
jgi:hypothetical protein